MNGRKDVSIYQNIDNVEEKHRFIADANLMYLSDTQETERDKIGKFRNKPYVFYSQLPDMSHRAIISKTATETIELLDYACKSPLFEFGEVGKIEYLSWKDNDLYTDKDGYKYMPWELFQKIKQTYRNLRGNYNYTHDLTSVKILFDDYEVGRGEDKSWNGKIDACMSMKLSFFVPINHAPGVPLTG
ncbi:hypothetical protein CYMTET_38607 [Cymbomonas tetramitiformis]|uniref:Uncharacterized protein n=1 Tax=Cymbomonas tetramitiformis TaxID=36881 RepID=A0AAE0CD23_9CHLO|nr:hypothetical protein CYMTET_38607 [Cymbomonas tetramitiformis]